MADKVSLFTLKYEINNEASFLSSVNKASSATSNLTQSSDSLSIQQDKLQARLAATTNRLNTLTAQAAQQTASIAQQSAQLTPLIAQYGYLGDKILVTRDKLAQAQAEQNPQRIGAYKGQLTQLTSAYDQVNDRIESLQKSLAKERQGLAYTSAQTQVKKARISELNSKISETDQLLTKTGKKGFLASLVEGVKEATSSWSNMAKAINQGSVTIDRLTRSAQRGIKIANTLSSAFLGHPLTQGGQPAGDPKSVKSFADAVSGATGPIGVFRAALTGLTDPMGAIGFISHTVSTAIGNLLAQALIGGAQALIGFAQAAIAPTANLERLGLSLKSLVAQELVQNGQATDMAEGMKMAAPQAQALLKWVQQLAIQSPFSVDDIRQSFLLAKSYGFTADEAKRLTQVLTDWASATGRAGFEMERVTLALSQIRAQGKLTGEDIRQLAQVGVSVDQILAKALNKTTAEIIAMREKGLIPAEQALELVTSSLEKDFGGAAAAQAKSLSGLMSSLGDVGQLLLSNLFGPIDQASGKVGGLLGAMQTQLSKFVDFLTSGPVQGAVTFFGTALGGLADNAFSWGSNIVTQLANGMMAAIGAVFDAITNIGSEIASLLAPGSPPKFLPDIDTWGAKTFQVYMQGWTKFGSQIFSDLAGDIEGFLRSLSKDILPETQLIPSIIGSRDTVGVAVKELETVGKVSESTLQQIIRSMGAAGAATDGYIRALFNTAAAQKELDAVTQKYDTELDSLNKQLDALEQAHQDKDDAKQIERLTRISQDAGASEKRRTEAQYELDKLILKKKIRDTESEKKLAVDASKKKVDAAQAQLDVQKMAIGYQQKQNDLLKEQASLLERLAKAAENGAKGGGGPKPAVSAPKKVSVGGAGVGKGLGPIDGILTTIQVKLQLFQAAWERVWSRAVAIVAPLAPSFDKIKAAFDKVGAAFQKNVPLIEEAISRIVAHVIKKVPELKPYFDSMGNSISIVADLWDKYGDNIIGIVEKIITWIIDRWVDTMNTLGVVIEIGMKVIQGILEIASKIINTDWNKVWEDIKKIPGAALDAIGVAVLKDLNGLAGFISSTLSKIRAGWDHAWNSMKDIASNIWGAISGSINGGAIVSAVSSAIETVKTYLNNQVSVFRSLGFSILTGLRNGIMDAISTVISGILYAIDLIFNAAQHAIDSHSPSMRAAEELGEPIGTGTALGMLRMIPMLQKAVGRMMNAAVTPPASASQQMASSYSYSMVNNYNYAPTYGSAPNNPSRDFAVMRVLAGA